MSQAARDEAIALAENGEHITKAQAERIVAQAMKTEAERQACEIRLRAERKAGKLLAAMQKAKGGRPEENRSQPVTGSPQQNLADLGISKL